MSEDPGIRPSAEGELSTLRSQLDELARRVTRMAEEFGETPDSAIAANLFAVEQALHGARIRLERAGEMIASQS